MGFGPEITGKLGIDTSSVPGDLAKAKGAMDSFARNAADAGGAAGAGAGDKLTNALEHRILGARHLSGALATALGLNIENIAEHITAGIMGGTKEAWKQMGELAERNAALIEKRMEIAMTPKQLSDKAKKDLERAQADLVGAKDKAAPSIGGFFGSNNPVLGKIAESMGLIKSEAERGVIVQEASVKVNEAALKVDQQTEAVKISKKKLDEHLAENAAKHLTSSQKVAALEQEQINLDLQILSGKFSEVEVNEKLARVDDIRGQIKDENLARDQRANDKANELLRLQISYNEARRKLAQDEDDLAAKKGDRSKLTIAEIARLSGGGHPELEREKSIDTFGLSDEQAAAKQQATDIERNQRNAERLRLSGDSAGASALFDQIGAQKDQLVSSGFAKSSEGDEFKKMGETLHHDSLEIAKIASEIKIAIAGKMKNE